MKDREGQSATSRRPGSGTSLVPRGRRRAAWTSSC